jgi:murein L,D-transpeptidase YcbB/YkuD
LFIYITTADSDGHLIFGDDPYQYDKALIDALNKEDVAKV